MYSSSLQNWLDKFLVEGTGNTYKNGNFTITVNGSILDGSFGSDRLSGGAANDILWGNSGNDNLTGGGGTDFLNGGAGNDRLDGNAGDDRLEGWGNDDKLYGGMGSDALYGGTGNDDLYGGDGNDWLCAGSGKDELYGGAGADTFVFRPDPKGAKSESVYMDFEVGVDELRIDRDLLPNGFSKSMIKVEADGDLFIQTADGHRMTFETLDKSDINALYNDIVII